MSDRTRTIDAWIDWAFERERLAYVRVARGILDGHGLIYEPTSIEFTGGNGMAVRVERTRERGAPLARMTLPNPVTERRWGQIYRALRRKGIQVYVVPRAVLDESDIRRKSINVIHSESERRWARPPHQLIEATVSPRWERKTRQTYFLSGYDLNEKGLSYFFCELPPHARPTTVEEAYQALQPESVKRARAQRRKVLRQGDMFFIQTRGEEGPPDDRIITDTRLFDTNHFVPELARHNGLVMVRGKVSHRPLGRRPDHRPLRLPGRGWWIAVRNTVPVVRRGY